MKKNPVKAALAAGKPQVGTWLSFGDIFTARLMAQVGFPWLTVDLEHSPIDWQMASLMFATIADSGCVPLARVPRGDHDLIKRVLDGGAMGIVVPMVNTVEEAKIAIAAAKYANQEILVILQTESPQGVDNAEAIYSLPGVDAIFVGPNDLFWQMKKPDGQEPTPAEFEAMLQRVLAAGKKTGTPVGIHTQSVQEVQHRISEGWQFLALQSELKMMVTKAQELVAELGISDTPSDLVRY
jgi:4-hydroxy-2-oxoheptanedioate aldolase